MPSRRRFLRSAPATVLVAANPAGAVAGEEEALPPPIRALSPMTEGLSPITVDEHRARMVRAQTLMAESGLDAVVMGPGTSLAYFTGARWHLSERFFGAVLFGTGEPRWVTPAFEKDRGLEQIRVGSDVRAWEEDSSPFATLAGILKEHGAASGRIGIEETMPWVFSSGLSAQAPSAHLTSATPVTAGCRMVKDGHELALMRRACTITLHAHRAVLASLTEGTTAEQAMAWSTRAHERLGVSGGALVLFGPDAAYPHGTKTPRPLRRGDVVLIDGGGSLHGYASDVTRTAVFGAPPTNRQRRIWDLVRRAQRAAFDVVRPGVSCEAVDAAARRVVEEGGFGPGYARFTHRLGHGIGLDVHEWPYMVQGDATPLRSGMTLTNEPGIYIPGELGIRHEDTVVVTEESGENLAPRWSGTPEEPAVV